MTTGFVLILAAMHLTAPVRCYTSETAWAAQERNLAIGNAMGYYEPATRTIGLSPWTCQLVRRPTLEGANVLAHELAHAWQDANGLALNERQADRIAAWAERGLLRRLVAVLGRPAFLVQPDPVVLP